MEPEHVQEERAAKRRRIESSDSSTESETDSETECEANTPVIAAASPLPSLSRSISPPPKDLGQSARLNGTPLRTVESVLTVVREKETQQPSKVLPSPIRLTRIRDLPESHNADTVSLKDLLRDPMIKECWQFNYLFDVGFLISALDEDVRSIVQVKVIHGSWKKEDPNRLSLEEQAKRYPNVQLIAAHMPEPFGTHHSKMMILIRQDDSAQVVIHTANMIARDWANLTQGLWRSPILPLLSSRPSSASQPELAPIGSGQRFKIDLLRYLQAYGSKLRPLVEQLHNYDFSAIRAALVASVPRRQAIDVPESPSHTSFGWPGLRQVLRSVPVKLCSNPSIVIQVSSIATLGATDKWLTHFLSILSNGNTSSSSHRPSSSLPTSPWTRPIPSTGGVNKAALTSHLIFPTTAEIRTSLDGYASGASIHTKIQNSAQQKQLQYLRPVFRHWDPEPDPSSPLSTTSTSASTSTSAAATAPAPKASAERLRPKHSALRARAAPHIKTYIRFSGAVLASKPPSTSSSCSLSSGSWHLPDIDYALLTSANLSTQAWGALPGKDGDVRICSYEIGVVVWPALFASSVEEEVRMVPTLGKDAPDAGEVDEGADDDEGDAGERDDAKMWRGRKTVIGLRMPYDIPLTPYKKDEVPWCAAMAYEEADWMGQVWGGY